MTRKTGIKAVILKEMSVLKWKVWSAERMAGSRLASGRGAKTHQCAEGGGRSPLLQMAGGPHLRSEGSGAVLAGLSLSHVRYLMCRYYHPVIANGPSCLRMCHPFPSFHVGSVWSGCWWGFLSWDTGEDPATSLLP